MAPTDLLDGFLDRLEEIAPSDPREGPWIVALSGGPDSVALCCLLKKAQEMERGRKLLPERIVAFHVNHGLRGASSDGDQAYSEELAAELGFDFLYTRLDPPSRETMGSMESWARKARFQAFQKEGERLGATAVLTGHQREDQAETVIQRLMRGSGLKGLSGIPSSRPLAQGSPILLLRPLLPFARDKILLWLEGEGRAYRLDASNLDTTIQRNWIRHKLIPALDRMHPQGRIVDELYSLSLEGDRLFRKLDEASSRALSRIGEEETRFTPFRDSSDEVTLERRLLEKGPELFCYAMLDKAAAETSGLKDPSLSRKAFEEVLAQMKKGIRRATLLLGRGVEMELTSAEARFRKEGDRGTPSFDPVPLPVPGHAVLPDGSRIHAETAEAGELRKNPDPLTEVLDADRVGDLPLFVRPRRTGDHFHPLGATGKKKLKDLLIDAKVPVELRGRMALVATREEILWVVGFRLGHACRVTSRTRRFLILKARPFPER